MNFIFLKYSIPIFLLFFLIACKEEVKKESIKKDSKLQTEFTNSFEPFPNTYDTSQFHFPTEPIDSIGNRSLNKSKIICDSLIKSFFGTRIFDKNIRFDSKRSFGNLTNKRGEIEICNFDQKIDYQPHLLELIYHLIYDHDTIHTLQLYKSKQTSFEITPEMDMKLVPYKLFLKNEFTVNYKKAKIIALKNGIEKDMKIDLITNSPIVDIGSSTYSWLVTPLNLKKDIPKKALIINVITGETKETFSMITTIECS